MLDDGKVTFCDLTDRAPAAGKPDYVLKPVYTCMFENRIIGNTRRYAAIGVNQEISALIRVWRPPLREVDEKKVPMVQVGMYAIVEGSEIDGQYRVDVTQPLSNFDGINILEVTLSRLENNYDVATET